MTKQSLIYGTPALILGICLTLLCYRYFRDGATMENCHELKEGMTKSEVRSILGWSHDYSGFVLLKGQAHVDVKGKHGTVMLAFDPQDRLVWKAWDETRRRETLLEQLLHGLLPVQKVRE